MNQRLTNNAFKYAVAILLLAAIAPCYGLSIVAGPYLQNPSRTSMTIMWLTDANCTSWVEYGKADALDNKAFHSEGGLIDADCTVNRITITGLSPATKYSYRVCSKQILTFEPYKVTYGDTLTGDTHTFTTLPGRRQKTSFVVFNDIHERNDLFADLLKQASSKPFDLVFLNGDMLGDVENSGQIIDHVLKPCSQAFATEIPFIYVRGNHETRGRFARELIDYIATPNGKFYYSFDDGPIHFLVMDGGEDKEDSAPAYSGLADFDNYRTRQKLWLEKEIQHKSFINAPFRIVLVHMPPTQKSDWHGVHDIYNKWRPLFNKAKVDLLICGHTHNYKIIEPQPDIQSYPIIIGGGPKKTQATVIRVQATPKKLNATITTDQGEKVGTYQIIR